MEWITPKINWVILDKFNIGDYNRIRNNLLFLQDLAAQLYIDFPQSSLGNEKTYNSDYLASEFNSFESILEIIKNNTFALDIGSTETFFENGPFILWSELNRIESACLKYYAILNNQFDNRWKLNFVVGTRIGDEF